MIDCGINCMMECECEPVFNWLTVEDMQFFFLSFSPQTDEKNAKVTVYRERPDISFITDNSAQIV